MSCEIAEARRFISQIYRESARMINPAIVKPTPIPACSSALRPGEDKLVAAELVVVGDNTTDLRDATAELMLVLKLTEIGAVEDVEIKIS